jgi:hypothetical protein
MKKLYWITLALTVILPFSSCGRDPVAALGLEDGEFPPFINLHCMNELTVDVGETAVGPEIFTFCEPDEFTLQHFSKSDLEVTVWAVHPEIPEIVSFDSAKPVNNSGEGITVKGLQAGTSKVFVQYTYPPTGGRKVIEATVTVAGSP